MSDVYVSCPELESRRFRLRFAERGDIDDLLEVYSDKNALPFFNSDNCNGDNFYYPTKEKMEQAMEFWLSSYETRWFVRWAVIDRARSKAVGTLELFHRTAEDCFDGTGVLRLDLRSDYERAGHIGEILELMLPPAYELFDCEEIITKVPVYAIERMTAVSEAGFVKSGGVLIGTHDGCSYKDYWIRHK